MQFFTNLGGCENKICHYHSICETDERGRSHCVCPQVCLPANDPICGSDNKDYKNECEMQVESCKLQKYINVASKGKYYV